MSDDREWGGRYPNPADRQYITLTEYVKRVVAGGAARAAEFDVLMRLFGAAAMEEIMAGKKMADFRAIIPGMAKQN